jgi:hypothetical protein
MLDSIHRLGAGCALLRVELARTIILGLILIMLEIIRLDLAYNSQVAHTLISCVTS